MNDDVNAWYVWNTYVLGAVIGERICIVSVYYVCCDCMKWVVCVHGVDIKWIECLDNGNIQRVFSEYKGEDSTYISY